jgi:hypothetical protein
MTSTVTLKVERRKRTVVDRERGYLPVERVEEIQQLVRITEGRCWFLPFRYREILDTEIIPDHVLISLGCFGDTGGWLSKFTDHIQ